MHKWATSFSLGVNCLKRGIPRKSSVICLVIFSFASPLGILVGWLLDGFNPIIGATLLCFSCGTYIYIACVEVMFVEFSVSKYKFRKMGSFVAGFVQVFFLICIEWLSG